MRNLARPKSLVISLVFLLSAVVLLVAQQPRPVRRLNLPAATSAITKDSRPRLVLLIVVDQFRYDYLTRFGDLFGARGIGRLMREGASWTEVNFDQVPTFTAPGHAFFMTGACPPRPALSPMNGTSAKPEKKLNP